MALGGAAALAARGKVTNLRALSALNWIALLVHLNTHSEFRTRMLGDLGCYATEARTFDVVAGAIYPDAPEVDLLS